MLRDKIAREIYEATRVEAEWSKRRIVPEPWERRDESFRKQFVSIVGDYLNRDNLPTPEEAHNSWMESYFKMGWTYGEIRDTEKKTHPDLVPYDDLPQDEKDKDAIFLAFVWEAKQILALIEGELEEMQKGLDAVQDLINNSYGVAGLHLNGDVAPWDELLEGGRFEAWLKDFSRCGKKVEVSP